MWWCCDVRGWSIGTVEMPPHCTVSSDKQGMMWSLHALSTVTDTVIVACATELREKLGI